MSNHNLFIKTGFPRAPLQNGLGRYVGQLQRITLKFCKNHGGSKGMRDFLEHDLINFAKSNPGTVVYVKPRRHRGPVMVAEYLNGERQWMCCNKFSRQDIHKWISLLREQNGDSSSIRLRKLWHTDHPSIQGPWTPFTHRNPTMNLVVFPDKTLSKPLDVHKTATEQLMEMFEKQKFEESNEENDKDAM